MSSSTYNILDWHRILLGEAPIEFLFETLIRSLIMYAFLVLTLRLLGKRMNSQATIAELAVTLMLGAIIALPIESADRGMLPGVLLLIVVLSAQRWVALIGSRKQNSRIVASAVTALIIDGEMQREALAKERITEEQLFSILRQRDIKSLGEVERFYFESYGDFSLFKFKKEIPGLSIAPYEGNNVG